MRKNEWQLQVLVKQAYGELNRIGRSIIDHACIEVCQVIDEIDEIMNSPLIEKYGTAFGGFCSLSGRLAGVMSTMAKIGDVACEEAKSSRDASDHKIPHLFQMMHIPVESCIHEQQLRRQLEAYVQRFRGLSEDLKRLIGMDVQFITCDAYVLYDHPELTKCDAIRKRFAKATNRLAMLSNEWWDFAEDAKKEADADIRHFISKFQGIAEDKDNEFWHRRLSATGLMKTSNTAVMEFAHTMEAYDISPLGRKFMKVLEHCSGDGRHEPS
jgi:hypothetical protein